MEQSTTDDGGNQVTEKTRKERKEEGKRMKRQKIEISGGIRPRKDPSSTAPSTREEKRGPPPQKQSKKQQQFKSGTFHKFGRVMDQTPCPGKPRLSTLSIAVPGSIVSNAQTRELKTYLVSQIARAATIYHVDEIVVFDDKLSVDHKKHYRREDRRNHHHETTPPVEEADSSERPERPKSSDPHTFMARILQYCECPQYLRRSFFPMHPDLQFAGLLPPIDAPHHVRADDRCKYREGVVMDKTGPNGGSLVNCGIRNRPVEIDTRLKPGIRCTVQLDAACYRSSGSIQGKVVSPSAPKEDDGTYWGYTTRLASSLKQALDECPFSGGYDLKIGTSERGSETIESKSYSVPTYKHAIIVFGGVAGIEECVDADESIQLPGSKSHTLFDQWVNICPLQGSRTIRTEEAVMIALAKLCPTLSASSLVVDDDGNSGPSAANHSDHQTPKMDLNDEDVSEESSESDSE